MSDRLTRARATGVLAVLRASTPELALEASEAIIRGGVTGIEVTFSTPMRPPSSASSSPGTATPPTSAPAPSPPPSRPPSPPMRAPSSW